MSVVENSNVTIAHLGIVAGLIDTLGIVEYIDKEIPKKRHHAITHGEEARRYQRHARGQGVTAHAVKHWHANLNRTVGVHGHRLQPRPVVGPRARQ